MEDGKRGNQRRAPSFSAFSDFLFSVRENDEDWKSNTKI